MPRDTFRAAARPATCPTMPRPAAASASPMLSQPTNCARLRKTDQVKAQASRKPVALPPGPSTAPRIAIPSRTIERKTA